MSTALNHPRHAVRNQVVTVGRAGAKGRVIQGARIAAATQQPHGPDETWRELVTVFRGPAIRIVLLDLSSADVAYIPEAFACGVCPDTFAAKLTALLYARYVAVHGDEHRRPAFECLNGAGEHVDSLCQCMLDHAQNWALPGAFAPWITGAAGLGQPGRPTTLLPDR